MQLWKLHLKEKWKKKIKESMQGITASESGR